MKELLTLFLTFARIGGLTFGGGYAMLPMLQREVVERYHWATEEELADYYAIGQCTPGVIAVNTATFIGCKQRGILGGIVATLGVAFPSLVIITIIAAFLQNFADYEVVQDAFAGISVCVCVLILRAVLKLWKKSVVSRGTLGIFLAVFVGSVVLGLAGFDVSPVVMVILSGLAGVVLRALGHAPGGGKS
ncbi:MAG: chromate transporter [Butyricicoccus sp.]